MSGRSIGSLISLTLLSSPHHLELRVSLGVTASGGWIAYTKPSSGGTVQIWVRDPAGTHTQVSFFSGFNTLEELLLRVE